MIITSGVNLRIGRRFQFLSIGAAESPYDVSDNRPELVLDFVRDRYFAYPYSVKDTDPVLVLDFVNEKYEAA